MTGPPAAQFETKLKNFLHAGGTSAMALALLIGIGGSSTAFAQVTANRTVIQNSIPTAQAVTPVIGTAQQAAQPLPRGNIYTLPLRPAPVKAAPAAGQSLAALVAANGEGPALDAEGTCLATAVYFESMGESLEGQLAVAHVVMNRAASGQYPASWCEVVKQPWQFSFVRHGTWPQIRDIDSWRTAEAITRIAMANAYESVPTDVLWYHANYVSPSWGRRLAEVAQIGAHIFYRA